jgi:ribonuclease BN (tRNA processing enzyme)
MKLTILGSGTMMPVKKRYPAAYMLDAGSTRLLLDCGSCTLARLVEHNIAFREIEMVGITHFHTDHFSNLLPLVHALWVDSVATKRQPQPLTIMGPKSIEERWQKLREVYWPEPEETYPVAFFEGPAQKSVGTVTVESFDVKHVQWFSSIGFRITAEGKTLVYTGDIGSDHPWDDLVSRVRGAQTLLIEAGATKPASNHFTIEQILKLKDESGVAKVIITHVREQNLPVLRSKIGSRKDVVIAEDGMVLML